MNTGNLFAHRPGNVQSEIVEQLGGEGKVRIERIVSHGQPSPPHGWYEQAHSEWVVLLSGAARLNFFDGTTFELSPGDYVEIPPGCRHRVAWTPPETDTVWLAVHF